MIKKLLTALAVSALIAVALFGLMVFIVWDTDVEKWGPGIRASLAWLWVLLSTVACGLVVSNIE